jgi:hypothetical protein
MHPRILAQRSAVAHERLAKAARKLARHHHMGAESRALHEAQAMPPTRNAMVRRLFEVEALADLLESITDKMGEMKEEIHSAETVEHEQVKVPARAVGPVTVETVEVVENPVKEKAKKPARAAKGKEADDD